MRKLSIILLLCITTSVSAQFQQKPMLGVPISSTHPLGTGAGGLVGIWLFNEGSGNKAFDLSGNKNAGTFVNNTHFVSGKFGSAVAFDGVSDRFDIVDNPSLPSDHFTYIAWINHRGSHGDTDGGIWYDRFNVDGENAICISNEDGIKLFFKIAGTSRSTEVAAGDVTQGVWHQVAVTHDGISQKVYLDGVFVGGMSFVGALGDSTNTRFIGVGFGTSQRDFNGSIDHSLLYNRALSPSEVAEIYADFTVMMQKDDIALMAAGVPAPTGGQVIMITSLPWILSIPLLYGIAYLRTKYKEAA